MWAALLAVATVLPLAAYFLSGVLAVLLQPRNPAARRLLVAGVLLPCSRLLEHLVLERPATAAALAEPWLLRWLADTSFLVGLAALVGALAVFPDGRCPSRAGRLVVRVVVAAALLSSAAVLVGSASLGVGGQSPVVNPVAVPELAAVGAVGRAVAASEPLWALAGVLLLFRRRRRASAVEREELRWPLRTLAAFAAALVLAIATNAVTEAMGAAELAFVQPLFLLALALFPVSLVAGIAARGRRIERELQESRRRLLHAEDAARRQLERDLHDGAQQQLVGVLSLLQLAQRQQSRNDPQTSATLERAVVETRHAMRDLRAIAAGIHPSVLSDRGLVEAMDSRLSVLPFAVTLDAAQDATTRRWPPAMEAAAYFVACEALTNAAKHADPDAVRVRIGAPDGDLHVVVQDDGRGFDPARTPQRGLAGAADRVEGLGGRLEVRSAPGAGTTVEVLLPGEAAR